MEAAPIQARVERRPAQALPLTSPPISARLTGSCSKSATAPYNDGFSNDQESFVLRRRRSTKVRKRSVVSILMFVSLLLPGIAREAGAGIAPSPFTLSNALDSSIFWVMFNPQPEPPGSWMLLDSTDPTAPVFTLENPANGQLGLSLWFTNAADPFTISHDGGNLNQFHYSFLNALGVPQYTATCSFQSAGSDVMFNPQPEPPGLPEFAQFELRSQAGGPLPQGQEVDMTLRLADVNGQTVSMAPVPEPATVVLLGLGMAAAAIVRKTRKK